MRNNSESAALEGRVVSDAEDDGKLESTGSLPPEGLPAEEATRATGIVVGAIFSDGLAVNASLGPEGVARLWPSVSVSGTKACKTSCSGPVFSDGFISIERDHGQLEMNALDRELVALR